MKTVVLSFCCVLLLVLQSGCSSGTSKANSGPTLDSGLSTPDASTRELPGLDLPLPLDVVPEIVRTGPYTGLIATGPRIQEILGVSTHMSRNVEYSWKREAELDGLEELGFSRVRSDFYWKNIEKEEGQYDLSGESHMTDLCLERGFSVLGILLIPPQWAQVDGTFDSVDPDKWRAFVHYTVEQMSDRIHSWEIWNEQNLDVFWSPLPNPNKFGEFLKIAAEEIRQLDPDAEIVFGGLSPFQFHSENIWGFLLDVAKFHPDVCDYFDSMAIHPYTFAQQYSPEYEFKQGTYVHPAMGGLIEEARFVLDKIGCPGRLIHLTEAGWPHFYMGEEKQGAFSVRGLLLAAAAGAGSYYWYTFWDSQIGPDDPAPTESTFGLMTWPESLDIPGQKKASFHAMLGASSRVGQSRLAGDLGQILGWQEHLHAIAFVDDATHYTVAVWHSLTELQEEVEVELPTPLDSTSWNRYDQSGNLIESGTASPVPMVATGPVSYLTFK